MEDSFIEESSARVRAVAIVGSRASGFAASLVILLHEGRDLAGSDVLRQGQPRVDAQRRFGLTNLAPKLSLFWARRQSLGLFAQTARFLRQALSQRCGLLEAAAPFDHDVLIVFQFPTAKRTNAHRDFAR